MAGTLLSLAGGIGLFLFGMQTMTDALRRLTSTGVRRVLRSLTGSPLRGVLAGAGVTALVQSSSAVMVMTIGLVGAGMITFAQAVGVVLGANVGTTTTGWIVALLGLKLRLGVLALGLLPVAVLVSMFGRGRLAEGGRALTGFALIFIGLDVMQTATAGFGGWLTPEVLPPDTLAGRLLTVAVGALVTVIIQSSSAGVATVLVLLAGGASRFPQAAALVIGMDLGTTVTALLAGLGGSRAMRQTGVAHLAYNIFTGSLAFAVMPVVLPVVLGAAGGDAVAGLVLFHTGFNLAGALLLLPFVGRFSAVVERMVPGPRDPLGEPLDPRLLSDEGAALDAAQGAGNRLSGVLLRELAARLRGEPPVEEEVPRIGAALDDLEAFATRINLPEGASAPRLRYSALLHHLDHLHRLSRRVCGPRVPAFGQDAGALARPAGALAAACLRAAEGRRTAAQMGRLHRLVAGRMQRLRRAALLREHAGIGAPGDLFHVTDALRWIERSAGHAARVLHYGEAAASERPSARQAARLPVGA